MLNRLLAYSPNLKQSWLLAVIILLCYFIIGGAAGVIMMYIAPKWAELAGSVLVCVTMALVVILMGKGSRHEPVASQCQSPLLWLLLVPFTLSFSISIDPLSMWIPMPDVIRQIFANSFQKNLPTFLAAVIIAPVLEEWLLRGIILKGLLKHYSPHKAIIWSAVIFGVVHLNPWQSIPTFFAGLMIGWIYWRTRSLLLCTFIHAVNNAAAFIFLFVFPDAPFNTTVLNMEGGYYMYAAALFVCVLTGLWIKNIISVSGTPVMSDNKCS